jgi:hypothetical protein
MLLIIIIILFLLGLYYLFLIQIRQKRKEVYKHSKKARTMPPSFVPIEDHIVPTHASSTNKFNNMIGNVNSSQGVGPGLLEVVIPSDFYDPELLPAEYKPYWPSGSISPDYIYKDDRIHSLHNR